MSSGKSISDVEDFRRSGIFDKAVEVGCSMIRRVDRSTVNNLVSLFLGRGDPVLAEKELILYIARQAGRGEIPRDIAAKLLSNIRDIRRLSRDERTLEELLSKYLVLVKWGFESRVSGARNLEDLVDKFIKPR